MPWADSLARRARGGRQPIAADAPDTHNVFSAGGTMRFRKKPVMIEAVLIGADAGSSIARFTEMPAWLKVALEDGTVRAAGDEESGVIVRTLEGELRGQPGDWLIRGVAGELYPCKPEIFDAIYERAPE